MPTLPSQDPSQHRTAAVWLDPDQVDLVRAVAASAGVRVVAAGGPQPGRAPELAQALGAEAADDLRAVLTTHDADLVLIAAPGEFASRDGDDWAVLEDRRARGGVVLTLEPMPASALHLSTPSLTASEAGSGGPGVALGPGAVLEGGGVGAPEWAAMTPLFRLGGPMRAAADVLAQVGPAHTVLAEFVCGRGEGTLGARLFDAVDAVTSILGDAESVDAMFVWPGRGKIVHPAVGESLRALAGVMTANLRFPDGRAAAILAGDASVGCGRWSRRLTVIGEGGRVTVSDAGFEFASGDGATVDRSGQSFIATAAAVLAEQVRLALDPHAPARAPVNATRVLAATGAALLSARTGEVESPETILRMAR